MSSVTVPCCPVCQDPLFGRATSRCESCDTSHHPECWEYAGGCSTYGCAAAARPESPGSRSFRSEGAFLWSTSSRVPALLGWLGALPFIGLVAWNYGIAKFSVHIWGLLVHLAALLEHLRVRHLEVDLERGRLQVADSRSPFAFATWEAEIAALRAEGSRLRVGLEARGNLGDVVLLELTNRNGHVPQTLAATRVRDWPSLRPLARDLARAMKVDLEVSEALPA